MNRREMLLASLGLAVTPSVAVRAEEYPRLVSKAKLSPEVMDAMRAAIEAMQRGGVMLVQRELDIATVSRT